MSNFETLLFERIDQSWQDLSPGEFFDFLRPKISEIITEEELIKKLESKKQLKVKFGIDPTAKDVHLGHIVPIIVLRAFIQAGHHIDLIIGDFTAQIGDPSGRETARNPLSDLEIQKNQESYREQIGRYLDITKIKVHNNSDWLKKLSLPTFFSYLQQLTLAQATQRDDFRARAKNQQGVSLAEVCYGVLMGIDSAELKSDIEIGGLDQLLNFQQCRAVMSASKMQPEVVLTTPIIEGTAGDGKKMSKSFGNYIAVTASLEEKFGKIMSIPDKLIESYYRAFTMIKQQELPELKKFIADSPLEAKKILATLIVAWETRDLVKAAAEREKFERKFAKGIIDESDVTSVNISTNSSLFDVIYSTGLWKSKSELRRLFDESAVREIGETEKILSIETVPESGKTIRVGKRKFLKLV